MNSLVQAGWYVAPHFGCRLFVFACAYLLADYALSRMSLSTFFSENSLLPNYARVAPNNANLEALGDNSSLEFSGHSFGEGCTHVNDRLASCSILGEKGDGTEGLLVILEVMGAHRNPLKCHLEFASTLIRQLKSSTFWARDLEIIIGDSDAIYGHLQRALKGNVESLNFQALQAALGIDFTSLSGAQCHSGSILIDYDAGGVFSNMDLFTLVSKGALYRAFSVSLKRTYSFSSSTPTRQNRSLKTLLEYPFRRYFRSRVDSVFLSLGEGGSTRIKSLDPLLSHVQSCCRSMNNMLEHLHHSLCFYHIIEPTKFVGISQYLPISLLIVLLPLLVVLLYVREGVPQFLSAVDAQFAKRLALKMAISAALSTVLLTIDLRVSFAIFSCALAACSYAFSRAGSRSHELIPMQLVTYLFPFIDVLYDNREFCQSAITYLFVSSSLFRGSFASECSVYQAIYLIDGIATPLMLDRGIDRTVTSAYAVWNAAFVLLSV